jgi:hypothetical protein
LEDLDAEVDINSDWETVRERVQSLAKGNRSYELEKHKPWFGKECSKLLD